MRGAYHSLAVDFDNDGDPDVITDEKKGIPGARPPRWFLWENEDGKVQPLVERVIPGANLGGLAAIAADFDSHGDVDLVSLQRGNTRDSELPAEMASRPTAAACYNPLVDQARHRRRKTMNEHPSR